MTTAVVVEAVGLRLNWKVSVPSPNAATPWHVAVDFLKSRAPTVVVQAHCTLPIRVPAASTSGLGVGLTSMRERATELGGTFAIASPESGGTAVRVALPLQA